MAKSFEVLSREESGNLIKTTVQADKDSQEKFEKVATFLGSPRPNPAPLLEIAYPHLPPAGIAILLGLADGFTAQVGPDDDTPGVLEPGEILQVTTEHAAELFSLVQGFIAGKTGK